jgi:two-component system, OmpR family, sensor histidine kinase VanS
MRKGFIANVSHELKTPISVIQGYAEGLKINVIEDEENKNFYCDVIVNEAKKMNQLVKSLLNLSLIDSGSSELEISVFNISELIEELVNKFLPIFNEKQVKLDLTKVRELMVSGDKLMIEQILVNYINNALNHINEKREIIIDTSKNESKARITMFNSGKQIPEEDIDKVWQSFYKVDKARTRAYGGTGLGLSIVAGIQKLHGNSYGVKNVEGGVEFWFDIDT